jgi:hypothetical protein
VIAYVVRISQERVYSRSPVPASASSLTPPRKPLAVPNQFSIQYTTVLRTGEGPEGLRKACSFHSGIPIHLVRSFILILVVSARLLFLLLLFSCLPLVLPPSIIGGSRLVPLFVPRL